MSVGKSSKTQSNFFINFFLINNDVYIATKVIIIHLMIKLDVSFIEEMKKKKEKTIQSTYSFIVLLMNH